MRKSVVTMLLDNEPLQALLDVRHRKHRRVVALVRGPLGSELVVPTAVRVEAAWDRHSPQAARVNQLRLVDFSLDTRAANIAAHTRSTLGVSVADAHLAAALVLTPGPHAVLTSDPDDVTRIAAYLQISVNVVIL